MDAVRVELVDDPTVDITTTGRRTGLPRRIEIWMLDVDGRFFITGTPGRRGWLANLHADPSLAVHLKRHAHLDLAARALPVTDTTTRRAVLEHLSATWYRTQQPLDVLVETAPMVEIVFDDAAGRIEPGGREAADYHWSCTTVAAGAGALTAERWLRCVWEEAPTGLRLFLRFGWRFGLGLRLGPPGPLHVLGWHIDESTATTVVVSARSPIVRAVNTLTVGDERIRWDTDVYYEHRIGHLVWFAASLLHQRIVPWSVRRTVASRV